MSVCSRCGGKFDGLPMMLGGLRAIFGVKFKLAAERFCIPCLSAWEKHRAGLTQFNIRGTVEDELTAFERGGSTRQPP